MRTTSRESRNYSQKCEDLKHIHYWAQKVFWATRPDQFVALDKKLTRAARWGYYIPREAREELDRRLASYRQCGII